MGEVGNIGRVLIGDLFKCLLVELFVSLGEGNVNVSVFEENNCVERLENEGLGEYEIV